MKLEVVTISKTFIFDTILKLKTDFGGKGFV